MISHHINTITAICHDLIQLDLVPDSLSLCLLGEAESGGCSLSLCGFWSLGLSGHRATSLSREFLELPCLSFPADRIERGGWSWK